VCDISSLRVNGPSEPGRLRDVCVCQWVKEPETLLISVLSCSYSALPSCCIVIFSDIS